LIQGTSQEDNSRPESGAELLQQAAKAEGFKYQQFAEQAQVVLDQDV